MILMSRTIMKFIICRGLVRGVSGVSIDTPRILKISTVEPQFQFFRRSKICLTPLIEIPNEASDLENSLSSTVQNLVTLRKLNISTCPQVFSVGLISQMYRSIHIHIYMKQLCFLRLMHLKGEVKKELEIF